MNVNIVKDWYKIIFLIKYGLEIWEKRHRNS